MTPPTMQPTWLETGAELTALLQPPHHSRWLLEQLAALRGRAQASDTAVRAQYLVGDNQLKPIRARVAALTSAPDDEADTLTLVVLHHTDGLIRSGDDRPLLSLIHGYAAAFPDDKWRATRWFLDTPERGLCELKLQSHRPRCAWFVQVFEIENLPA